MRHVYIVVTLLFNTCMGWVLGKIAHNSRCVTSVGNTKVTDLIFDDDDVLLVESMKALVIALEHWVPNYLT